MKTYTLLITGFAVHRAAATWNLYAKPFTNPDYNNNECSDKQKSGFDWSDLKDGDSNFQYGDFDFSAGWSCKNALGKRDVLTKRTFSNKAITNKCSKEKPASFGCDKRKDGFSITTIDVSASFDAEIDLHYTMKDGSICKQKSVPCKQSGNTIKNTQCGGAQKVDMYLSGQYKGDKSECEIGFHHIGFDCNPGKTYNPPSPPVISPPVSTPVAVSSAPLCRGGDCGSKVPASSTVPFCQDDSCNSQPPVTPSAPQSTHSISTPFSSGSCNGGYGGGCSSVQTSAIVTPPVATTPVQTPSSDVPYPYSSVAPFSNSSAPLPPTYQTTIPESDAVTPLPASSTIVPPPPSQESSSAVPPPCGGSYGGSCATSSAVPSSPPSSVGVPVPSPPSSSAGVPISSLPSSSVGVPVPSPPYSAGTLVPGTSSSAPQPSSPGYPPSKGGDVPPVLPQCMNTWLQISTEDCKDNTATDCYCKNSKFTKDVIDCVQSWCETDEETKQALQYLVGICATYVSENPGLVSNCPGDTFNTPATPTGGVRSTDVPVNTPAPSGTPTVSKPLTTIVYGSTSLTVPQVHFSTVYPSAGATPTAPVGLVPGAAPPSTPAATTGAPYPIPSTLKSTFPPTGTGAVRPSSPAEFTGAASPFKADAKHLMLGAAVAFLAL